MYKHTKRVQTQKTELQYNKYRWGGGAGRQAHDAGAWSRRKPKTKQRAGATLACYTFPIFLSHLSEANTDEIHNNTSYYTPENLITIDQFSTGRVYYSTSFIFQSPSKNLKDLKYLQKWHPHQCVAFFQNLKYSGFSVTRDQKIFHDSLFLVYLFFLMWVVVLCIV